MFAELGKERVIPLTIINKKEKKKKKEFLNNKLWVGNLQTEDNSLRLTDFLEINADSGNFPLQKRSFLFV